MKFKKLYSTYSENYSSIFDYKIEKLYRNQFPTFCEIFQNFSGIFSFWDSWFFENNIMMNLINKGNF